MRHLIFVAIALAMIASATEEDMVEQLEDAIEALPLQGNATQPSPGVTAQIQYNGDQQRPSLPNFTVNVLDITKLSEEEMRDEANLKKLKTVAETEEKSKAKVKAEQQRQKDAEIREKATAAEASKAEAYLKSIKDKMESASNVTVIMKEIMDTKANYDTTMATLNAKMTAATGNSAATDLMKSSALDKVEDQNIQAKLEAAEKARAEGVIVNDALKIGAADKAITSLKELILKRKSDEERHELSAKTTIRNEASNVVKATSATEKATEQKIEKLKKEETRLAAVADGTAPEPSKNTASTDEVKRVAAAAAAKQTAAQLANDKKVAYLAQMKVEKEEATMETNALAIMTAKLVGAAKGHANAVIREAEEDATQAAEKVVEDEANLQRELVQAKSDAVAETSPPTHESEEELHDIMTKITADEVTLAASKEASATAQKKIENAKLAKVSAVAKATEAAAGRVQEDAKEAESIAGMKTTSQIETDISNLVVSIETANEGETKASTSIATHISSLREAVHKAAKGLVAAKEALSHVDNNTDEKMQKLSAAAITDSKEAALAAAQLREVKLQQKAAETQIADAEAYGNKADNHFQALITRLEAAVAAGFVKQVPLIADKAIRLHEEAFTRISAILADVNVMKVQSDVIAALKADMTVIQGIVSGLTTTVQQFSTRVSEQASMQRSLGNTKTALAIRRTVAAEQASKEAVKEQDAKNEEARKAAEAAAVKAAKDAALLWEKEQAALIAPPTLAMLEERQATIEQQIKSTKSQQNVALVQINKVEALNVQVSAAKIEVKDSQIEERELMNKAKEANANHNPEKAMELMDAALAFEAKKNDAEVKKAKATAEAAAAAAAALPAQMQQTVDNIKVDLNIKAIEKADLNKLIQSNEGALKTAATDEAKKAIAKSNAEAEVQIRDIDAVQSKLRKDLAGQVAKVATAERALETSKVQAKRKSEESEYALSQEAQAQVTYAVTEKAEKAAGVATALEASKIKEAALKNEARNAEKEATMKMEVSKAAAEASESKTKLEEAESIRLAVALKLEKETAAEQTEKAEVGSKAVAKRDLEIKLNTEKIAEQTNKEDKERTEKVSVRAEENASKTQEKVAKDASKLSGLAAAEFSVNDLTGKMNTAVTHENSWKADLARNGNTGVNEQHAKSWTSNLANAKTQLASAKAQQDALKTQIANEARGKAEAAAAKERTEKDEALKEANTKTELAQKDAYFKEQIAKQTAVVNQLQEASEKSEVTEISKKKDRTDALGQANKAAQDAVTARSATNKFDADMIVQTLQGAKDKESGLRWQVEKNTAALKSASNEESATQANKALNESKDRLAVAVLSLNAVMEEPRKEATVKAAEQKVLADAKSEAQAMSDILASCSEKNTKNALAISQSQATINSATERMTKASVQASVDTVEKNTIEKNTIASETFKIAQTTDANKVQQQMCDKQVQATKAELASVKAAKEVADKQAVAETARVVARGKELDEKTTESTSNDIKQLTANKVKAIDQKVAEELSQKLTEIKDKQAAEEAAKEKDAKVPGIEKDLKSSAQVAEANVEKMRTAADMASQTAAAASRDSGIAKALLEKAKGSLAALSGQKGSLAAFSGQPPQTQELGSILDVAPTADAASVLVDVTSNY